MTNQDAVVVAIQEMLDQAEPSVTDECCIYRVPFDIRMHNKNAYVPKFVSIGPFHHNRHSHLQNMEKCKVTYCGEFLKRTQTSSDKWISYIEEVLPQFRRCYLQTLEFSNDQLVKIIFVDSGFIFEHFLKCYYHGLGSASKIFLLTPKLDNGIQLDLSMLENQLPFVVLEGLFNLSLACASDSGNNDIPSLLELAVYFFSSYQESNLPFDRYDNISIRHFTDLVRTFYLPLPQERPPRTDEVVTYFPSVTELSEAGLVFKVNTGSDNMLDLKFSVGVLQIPHLVVEESTEVLFRNMIALEQLLYPFESYIIDYARVLDILINTSRDVDILVRHKILTNGLGDTGSVAKLFNGLVQNVSISTSNSNYLGICNYLNAFYRSPRNKWMWTSSPWQTAAIITGIVLIFLSLVRIICTILQVIQH